MRIFKIKLILKNFKIEYKILNQKIEIKLNQILYRKSLIKINNYNRSKINSNNKINPKHSIALILIDNPNPKIKINNCIFNLNHNNKNNKFLQFQKIILVKI